MPDGPIGDHRASGAASEHGARYATSQQPRGYLPVNTQALLLLLHSRCK